MALALRIRTAALRHRSPENSGGSFGSKLVIFPHIVVLCVLARKAKRPIKWIEDRLEHLYTDMEGYETKNSFEHNQKCIK